MSKRGELSQAFNLWMDIYPESERWPEKLKAQKAHDQFMDHIGLNPKNSECQLKNPYNPLKITVCRGFVYYSNSLTKPVS